MRTYDIDDYGSQRRFPWLPLLILLVLAAGAGAWFFMARTGGASGEIVKSGEKRFVSSAESVKQGESSQSPEIPPKGGGPEGRGGFTPAQIEEGRATFDLILSQRPMEGKIAYKIKPGDSLSRIASLHNCPALLIQRANGITDPNRIRPGEILWILDKPQFSLEVSKNANTLALFLGGKFLKVYSVGTGANAKTPAGTYRIGEKTLHPTWWPGDGREIPFGNPDNILGTHWLALTPTGDTPPVQGYGIHGTWDDSSVGKQSSAGCIRMLNDDVAEVFMFVPRGTPVIIKED